MCKIVYLTSKLLDIPSRRFRDAVATELKNRKIEVVTENNYWLKSRLRSHKIYGIAIAIDFFRDKGVGSGITMSSNCSRIGREFAYSLSNGLDRVVAPLRWRDFEFISPEERRWKTFFNNIGSEVKGIFYLCTYNNEYDFDIYSKMYDKIVNVFVDEIVRCLRSNYDSIKYQKQIRVSNLRNRHRDEHVK